MYLLGILGFALIFVLIIVIFIFALLSNLIRSIFGIGKRTPQQYQDNKTSSTQTNNNYSSSHNASTTSSNGKKKIFSEDEGEYVEYEEIK